MDMVRGVVSRSSRSAEISGNQQGFGTSQILTCYVGGRPVEIWMAKMPIIHDGDEVAVAGVRKQGTLIARAYRNVTNGSSGRWDSRLGTAFMLLFFFIVFVPLTAGAGMAARQDPIGYVLLVPCLLWLVGSLYMAVKTFREAARTSQAYARVMSD